VATVSGRFRAVATCSRTAWIWRFVCSLISRDRASARSVLSSRPGAASDSSSAPRRSAAEAWLPSALRKNQLHRHRCRGTAVHACHRGPELAGPRAPRIVRVDPRRGAKLTGSTRSGGRAMPGATAS
jgi:hypothetical protein